jgi:molybdopterin molybdotransferase
MLDMEQALTLVLERAERRPPVQVEIADALGLVLAGDVSSDIDSPPHDKALMDGYAVRAADLAATGEAVLQVLEEVTAGAVPTQRVGAGTATRIMTGAPLPEGADAVVMVERSELLADSSPPKVRLRDKQATPGMNILRRAKSMRRGEVVLRAGSEIRPIEVGLLAEVGRTQAGVYPRPTVALLSTGDELVPSGQVPEAGRIRNSNGPMLGALAQRAGGAIADLGIARDREDALRERIGQGLRHDVLVLSGGVSMGVADLVPRVLQELGVQQVFHQVRLKPGKPLWFGTAPGKRGATLVFGLPGNPVSSLVCFELFVRPALAQLAGRTAQRFPTQPARMAREHRQRSDRPVFHPARLRQERNAADVELLAWQGSADLRTLAEANCLAHFPPGERTYAPGDAVEVLLL